MVVKEGRNRCMMIIDGWGLLFAGVSYSNLSRNLSLSYLDRESSRSGRHALKLVYFSVKGNYPIRAVELKSVLFPVTLRYSTAEEP